MRGRFCWHILCGLALRSASDKSESSSIRSFSSVVALAVHAFLVSCGAGVGLLRFSFCEAPTSQSGLDDETWEYGETWTSVVYGVKSHTSENSPTLVVLVFTKPENISLSEASSLLIPPLTGVHRTINPPGFNVLSA